MIPVSIDIFIGQCIKVSHMGRGQRSLGSRAKVTGIKVSQTPKSCLEAKDDTSVIFSNTCNFISTIYVILTVMSLHL